jgi:hypothetical protein
MNVNTSIMGRMAWSSLAGTRRLVETAGAAAHVGLQNGFAGDAASAVNGSHSRHRGRWCVANKGEAVADAHALERSGLAVVELAEPAGDGERDGRST